MRSWFFRLQVLAIATSLILFVVFPAFSVPAPTASDKDLRAKADRYLRGEPFPTAEKLKLNQFIEQNQSLFPPPAPLPRIMETDTTGGPDGFGYRFIDSRTTGGPAVNWENITGGTTPTLAMGGTDDGYYGPLNIGFTFSFYGTPYTQFYLGTNGYINFGTGTNSIPGFGNWPLNGWPAGIYFWGRDASTTYATAVRYQTLTNPNRLVIEIDGFAPVYWQNAQLLDFQAILYQDGAIKLQYRNYVGDVRSYGGNIGLQTVNGTQYNFPFCTQAAQVPPQNDAILFYTLGQPSGPVPPDSSTNIATNTMLQWSPAMAAAAYNVLFGTVNPPVTVVSTHQTGLSYTPTLANTTTYYWQVVSLGDTAGTTTNPGPIWRFTTGTGAAPAAPSGGFIAPDTDATTSSLHLHWTSNSAGTETGFYIARSTDGVTFTRFDSVGTGVTQYRNTGLSPNVRYYYRVYSHSALVASTQFASMNGWTLANVPGRPTFGPATPHTIPIYFGMSVPNGNSANTQYAIYIANISRYVQADGSPDTGAVWQTIAQWGDPTVVIALVSTTYYTFQIKARNGANIPTAFGLGDSLRTGNGLSGTYTIGGVNPDFSTIHDAINAISVMRVGSPGITFLIRGGTYNEVPDTIGVSAMTGASSKLVFRPADTNAVIINKQCNSTMPFAFKIQGATHVTFDGSPASAPGRRVMTINATDANYGFHTFWFANGASYNTVKNLNMNISYPSTSGGNANPVYAYYQSGQQPNTPCSNDSIINCRINGGYYSIYLYSTGTALSNWYIAKNQIFDFSYYGVYLYGCANSKFVRNEIALTAPQPMAYNYLYGFYTQLTGNTNNVYDGNWIHDLYQSASNGYIYAMYMYYGANSLIMNNMINLDPVTAYYIYGIYLYNDRMDILNNTIRIGGTGSSQQTYGIFFNTTTQDTMANNILINERVSAGTNTCLWANASVTAPPWALSDYNLLTTVDTTVNDNRYAAYMNGYYNTLANLRAVTNNPSEIHSISIPPQFAGIPNLHIDLTSPTAVESAGRPFTRVTTDIDGEARNATTPDIGCDEGNFITGTDLYPPRINMTPLGLWNTSARVFSAYITDNVSVAIDTLCKPRVYYKLSTDANYNFRRADSTSDSTFWFTIPGFPMGSIVNYYVAAQDTSRNVNSYPYGGRGSNPPGTRPPSSPGIYYVNVLLTGNKTIGGTNPDYPTLNAAVTALNNIGVGAGGVTFKIRNGNYTEPSVIISSVTDATRPVVFKVDSGATVTFRLTPSGVNPAGIQLLKSRYVTIDGSWPRDTVGKHLTFLGPTLTSIVWFSDSSSYNVVKNCVLDDSIQTNGNNRTVQFGNSSNFPPMVANKILYSDINGGYYGVYFNTVGGNERYDSTQISYCNIKNFYYYGMYLYYANGLVISHNNFFDTMTMTSGAAYCLYIVGSVNGSLFDGNKISSLLNQQYATFYGFYYVNGTNVYSNNMIDLGNGPYGTMVGIQSSGGGGKFLFNTVNIHGSSNQTSYYSAAYYNGNTGGTPDSLYGNIFQNTRTTTVTGAAYFHSCIWLQSMTTVGYSNNNLLAVGSNDATDNLYVAHIGAQNGGTNYNTFTDFITSTWSPRDANSYADLAPFVNDSNLHIQTNVVTPIESGAPRHWQVLTDYDGQTRNALADIGADEGNFRAAIYGTIQGIVRDSSTTRPPMPGVIVNAGRFSDTTDADGYYSMLVRTGTYNVVASTACFDSMWAMNVRVDSARTDTVNFDMLHPELTTDRTSLEMVGPPGSTRSTTLTLRNTGNGNLHWQAIALTDPHQDAIGGGGGSERPPINIKLVARTDKQPAGQSSDIAPHRGSASATDQVWGPEGYGYRAMDNQELTFPNYVQFTDIREMGTPITGLTNTTSDRYVFTRLSPMRFTYYGTVYDSIVVCNDGYVQFNNTGYAYGYNYAMPQTSFPNGVFVLHHYFNGNVYQYYDSTARIFYIQWAGVNRYATNDSLVFQLQLHSRINAMVFAYSNVTITNLYATIGIQNAQGANNRFIQCFFTQNTPFVRALNGYMIAFNDMSAGGGGAWPSWLNVTPGSGTTTPRQVAELFVQATIDTGITVPAVWTGSIRISSDACPNVVSIPVSVSITDAAPEAVAIPYQYKLYQNYPNPFNPTTEIRFDLKQPGMTRLTIYNALGRQVAQLVNSQLPAGYHSIRFDGSKLATGVYFYRVQSGSFSDVKKMVMLK